MYVFTILYALIISSVATAKPSQMPQYYHVQDEVTHLLSNAYIFSLIKNALSDINQWHNPIL